MPKIELSEIEEALFKSTRLNVETAFDAVAACESKANMARKEAAKQAKQAEEIREGAKAHDREMLLKIGRAHGVTIPGGAEIGTSGDAMTFEWPDPAEAVALREALDEAADVVALEAIDAKVDAPEPADATIA